MFKTIFSKLITIFILILIIAFSITGIMLYVFLDEFTTREKTALLERGSNSVDIAFSYYIEIRRDYGNAADSISERLLKASLMDFGNSTQSIIWIVDDKDRLFRSNWDIPQTIIDKYTDKSGNLVIPENKQFAKLSIEEATASEIGDFSGFFKDPVFKDWGDLWLTVGKSFTYHDNQGNDKIMIVYMNTPVGGVRQARLEVFKNFLFSMGIAIVIAALLIYIFSLRLTRPLKQIKNAAAKISNGEFERRLDIKSRDEIGELAKTFNQMAAALQNLEEMRRGFIANVSHELRTPMTSIRGFVEGILDGTIPPERQNHYLTIVRDETNRLNRLVNDLLDLAKMEAGEMKLTLMPVDINELLRKCVIKLETLLLEKDLTVDADFEEDGILVKADADAIERVVYNLMHNAIKFTPAGGNIKLLTVVQKDKVEVTVKDNGAGIDEEELDMIWDRFYKSDKSRSRDKTGTGLGLAIVRNIINEHGQKIWVESKAGEGTSFTFTLEGAYEQPDEQ
jgi:signal transduction histidine kinase